MKKHFDTESFVLGTFVGAAVAGITALLFSPKSGKDMRHEIGTQADKAKDQARDYVQLAKDKGLELKDTAEKAGSEYLENASATYEQLTHQAGSDMNETKDNLDEIKKEARETAENMKETLKEGTERDMEITKETGKDMKETVEEGKEEATNSSDNSSDSKADEDGPLDVTDTRDAKEPEKEDAREDSDFGPNKGPMNSKDKEDSLQANKPGQTTRKKGVDYNSNN